MFKKTDDLAWEGVPYLKDSVYTYCIHRPGVQPSLPSLLLCCHTDVVPANQSLWTQPAFEGTLVDGKIYGRGAQDMKSVGVQVNQKSVSCR